MGKRDKYSLLVGSAGKAVWSATTRTNVQEVFHGMAARLSAAALLIGFCIGVLATTANADAARPNILLIVADDLGWNDVGYHGSEISTPTIDEIARQGIELDRFYVQPSCSPTRASLLTGKSAITLGIYTPLNKGHKVGLPVAEKLLPEYLADLGYQRFMVGKWHLGKHTRAQLPNARGFEHFYGSLAGGVGHWDKVHGGRYDWQRNGTTLREEGYYSHQLADEVRTLVAERDPGKPSFLYVAFQAPHLPAEAPPETIARYGALNTNRALHAAMVDELDQAVGEILEVYRSAGMLENTIVFFTSDNGGLVAPDENPEKRTMRQKVFGWMAETFDRPLGGSLIPGLEFIARRTLEGGSDNSPLRGGKGEVTDGGARVPAAIWWPNNLEGGLHREFMSVEDVLPTLLEAIGASDHIPQDVAGKSRLSALQGGANEATDYLVAGIGGEFALYRWPWKYIGGDAPALFNILIDPLEQNNQINAEGDLAAELEEVMANWTYGPQVARSYYDLFFDPDGFGGEETDQPPWPDLVQD